MAIAFGIGSANALLLALLLLSQRTNRGANRLLAAMLAIVALRLLVYVLGFAGAYDDHPSLTFLPLDMTAGLAPLLFFYTRAITSTAMPDRWRWHLVPVAAQFAYQAACFLLPMPQKWHWYTTGHLKVIEPTATVVILGLAIAYVGAAWRGQASYQSWLDARYADRERWRLVWLRTMLAAFGALLLTVAGFTAWNLAVAPIGYVGRTPAMLGFCLLAYALGLLGWKNAAFDGPGRDAATDMPVRTRVDHAARAADWRRQIEDTEWWREEGLTLVEVARRLGASERSLSRALNAGGSTFNAAINAMRIAAVMRALADPAEERDLLTLAYDHGFASKASFNRAFRDVSGTTPSAWRRKSRQTAAFAAFETTLPVS